MSKCIEKSCKKAPNFNYINETKLLYCAEHALNGMVDVHHELCLEIGCLKFPSFNFENEKKPLYCIIHKKDNMINVKNKQCFKENCPVRPYFNYKTEQKGLYCKIHKKDNMVDVKHKRCIKCDKERALFNIVGNKQPLYCNNCKTKDMINTQRKHCLDCTRTPHFNLPGKTIGLYCSECVSDNNMVDVVHKKCIGIDCPDPKAPSYNYANNKIPQYCIHCKKDNMINVKHPSCKTPLCDITVTKKYEGYCFRCFAEEFPDKPISRNYKTKEREIIQFVKKEFPDYSWRYDKIIQDSCSKKRPDIFLDLGYQIIIIEIDENQHKKSNYETSCEHKRIMKLSQDVGERSIIFLRFNPDNYIKNKIKITSCWGFDKNRVLIIKNKEEWLKRLDVLKNEINYWCNQDNKSSKTIEIKYLFFDDD